MDKSVFSISEVLPVEILLKIFSNVDYKTIQILRLVSTQIKNLINDDFLRKTCIKITFSPQYFDWNSIQQEERFNETLITLEQIQLNLNFQNVRCANINFTSLTNESLKRFWNIFSIETVNLIIQQCKIKQNQLHAGLEKLINLKIVSLDIITHYDVIEVIDQLINRVISLTVSGNTWGRPPLAIHNDIETLPHGYKPAIKELKFLTAYNFCNPEVTKLFKVIAKSIKHLEICLMWYNVTWHEEYDQLQWFSEFDFELESLKLKLIGGTNYRTLHMLAVKQRELKHFEISWDMEMSKVHLECIARQMVNLRVLKFDCRSFGNVDYTILDLTKLDHLEELTIESSNKTQPVDNLNGICFSRHAKSSVKRITLECDFTDDVILDITNNLLSLQKLSLRQAKDKTFPKLYFQNLFKNLKNLKDLSIQLCSNGTILEHDEKIVDSIMDITHLRELQRVTFDGFSNCSEIEFKKLGKLPLLECVVYSNIQNKQIKISDVQFLLENCRYLKLISIINCPLNFIKDDLHDICRLYPNTMIQIKIDDKI